MSTARLLLAAFCLSVATQAVAESECSKDELQGYRPIPEEVAHHRKFEVLTRRYPFGTKLTDDSFWGVKLELRVDDSGHVVCYSARDSFHRSIHLVGVRESLRDELFHWTYEPFMEHGSIRPAVFVEELREEELPARHRSLPRAPLDRISIQLERSGCFGACPAYRVTVYGSGRVEYLGRSDVDVVGLHAFRIPRQEVADLVTSLGNKDLWSLKQRYVTLVSDLAAYQLTIRMGRNVRTIIDYFGEGAGMPLAVTAFEQEIDRAARIDEWRHVTSTTIERLAAEKYRFHSVAGADLLNHAIADEKTSDDAVIRLINLGAPFTGGKRKAFELAPPGDGALETAIAGHRANVVEALLSHGAIGSPGSIDQKRFDSAFLASIRAGHIDLVRRIWDASGSDTKPSLIFKSKAFGTNTPAKTSPVTLVLWHNSADESEWDGLSIARWLAELGCDLHATRADGANLLHIAADAGDADFVTFLLSQGLSTSVRNADGETPLESTLDDEVALVLLDAGAGPSGPESSWESVRKLAEQRRWEHALAWLTEHGH